MAIRILDCATMSPWFPRWHIGAACLLVETTQGLALVDTGLGLHDYANPTAVVRFFSRDFGVHNDPENTAVRQLAHLGHLPDAIGHIVMTHLHFDHAGGLPDFPRAQVHVHRREIEATRHRRGWSDLAYDQSDFVHGPSWILYDKLDADWFGLEAIRLPFSPQMYLVPLFGHTRGHCGVAIQNEERWLFHCADALPTNAQFDITPQWLNRIVLGPHVRRLQAMAQAHPEVQMIAGHMWKSFFETNILAG